MVMNILTEGKRFSPSWCRSNDVPLIVDLAVLHLTSKGEGVSCPSNDIPGIRHDCIFLEEVCRTIDNTSVLVLKMLVVCIEAHV